MSGIRAWAAALLLLGAGLVASWAFHKPPSSLPVANSPVWPNFSEPVARRLSPSPQGSHALGEPGDKPQTPAAEADQQPAAGPPLVARRAGPARNKQALVVPMMTPDAPVTQPRSFANEPLRDERRASPIGSLFGPVAADERAEADATDESPRWHILADGDTLRRLAEHYLGDAGRWQEIYDANRDVLLEPDVLPLGQRLRIPPRDAEPAAPAMEVPPTDDAAGPLVPVPD